MDKYEYKQLSERMIELMQNEEYGEAKEIADSIDWRRVRNAMMLANVSDIYEKTGEYQKSYDILQIAYHRAEGSRKVSVVVTLIVDSSAICFERPLFLNYPCGYGLIVEPKLLNIKLRL